MDWRRATLGGMVVVPALALLGFGMTLDPRALPSTMPGKEAPPFALEVMESRGQPGGVRLADLRDHRGGIVVLNFYASWCLSCRSEHDALSRVAARYEGLGVQFYGVLFNDTPANAARYIRMMGGQSYPTLLDPGTRTAIDYGVTGVPETFLIGPDGVVEHKQIGPVTEELLLGWLDGRLSPTEAR